MNNSRTIVLAVYIFCLFFCPTTSFSQHSGRISGIVLDKDSEIPLTGANVVIINSSELLGVETDVNGCFWIQGVSVGRHTIQVSFVGYTTFTLPNVEVISGRETQLSIALEQQVYYQEDVIIRADIRKDKPQNDMALISARTFSMEETERYAGSFGDPARMATNFAGVMQGGDQLNEIIIRGNSPAGLLYRVDGFTIPNPTHFSSAGTSGGAISMLNSNTMGNSDFYTGAFPAEYGNALSGVFDLKLRRGNSQKREYLFQVGFNGFEVGLEGPFSSKSTATYLLHYRYSTLEVFDWMGLSLPVSAVPYFQDITTHVNIPAGKFGNTSIILVAGKNNIKFERERQDTISGASLFGSATALAGFNHSVFLMNKIKLTAGIAFTYRGDYTTDTATTTSGRIDRWYGQDSWERGLQANLNARYKIDNRNTLNLGVSQNFGFISLTDSAFHIPTNRYIFINNIEGSYTYTQAFIQHRHRFTDYLSIVAGINFQHITISNSKAFEPRVAINYEINPNNTISAGMGKHNQIQPRHFYFIETLNDTLQGVYTQTNKNLGFSKSKHFVVGHQYVLERLYRVKSEVYYQQLHKIPVEKKSSYFSLINYGSFGLDEGNNTDSLVNEGTGFNYGLELTLERFLNRGWYMLFTASIFDSKYKGSDNVLRNTLFNSNFVFNMVGGYELNLSLNHRLAIDIKSIWAGGLRELPIDLKASKAQGRTVYDYQNAFANRFGDYFRLDIKASIKLNYQKVSHILAIELINSTNRKNHFIQTYNPSTQRIEETTQLGLTPLLMYRFVF